MNLCNAFNELWIYLNILIQVFTIDLSAGMFHYIFVYEIGVLPARSNHGLIRVLRVLLHQYINLCTRGVQYIMATCQLIEKF